MKVFRENEREIWLGALPGVTALGALFVGAFLPTLDFGQDDFRGIPGALALAIASLGLTAYGKHPGLKRWMTFAFTAAIPGLVRLPAGHGLEDLVRAYAGMLPHAVLGLLFLPVVRAAYRRFAHYRQSVVSPSAQLESNP